MHLELSCSMLQLGLRVIVFHTEENVLSSVCFPRGDREVISRSPRDALAWSSLESGNINIYLLERQNSCHSQRTPGSVHLESLEFTCGLQSVSKAFTHCFLYPWRLYITHLTENKFAMKEKPPTSVRLFLVNDHFKNKGELEDTYAGI